MSFDDMLNGRLTAKQVKRLLTPVRQDRVEKKQGMTYVPQHEVRAELTRTFGPGRWDSRVHDVTLLYETSDARENGKTYWTVCYRAAVTLRVRDFNGIPLAEFTEYHAEENAPQPNRGEAHALALTSVESYALRRAAIGLGDNMGLHLYNGGNLAPLIVGTLMNEEVFDLTPSGAPREPLSDQHVKVLQNSLGAQVISDEPAQAAEQAPEQEQVQEQVQEQTA